MFWIIITLCTMTATLAVSGKEPPSFPLILGLKNIDGGNECIVGEVGENVNLRCMINNGSRPLNVTLTIGNETHSMCPYNSTSTVYMKLLTLQDYHHAKTVTMSVMNDALSTPLKTTARVFVIKPPTIQRFAVPESLKEGDDVNIICAMDEGRPIPSVYFNISGSKVSSSHQHTKTSANENIVSLTMFEWEWNHENITCCRYNKWYKKQLECSPPEQVNYLYQSSTIMFNISDSILNVYKGEKVFVECSVNSTIASNLTMIENLGFKNMTMKRCYMATDCVLAFNTDVVGKRRLICATQNLESDDFKYMTLNILDRPEGLEIFDLIPLTLVIWSTIGSCLLITGIVIAIILFVVIRKKRQTPKNKEMSQERNHSDVKNIRNQHNPVNDLREEQVGTADSREINDKIPEYAKPVKRKTRKNVDNTHSQVNKIQYNVEDGQLHYASNDILSKEYAVKRPDSLTENADIDSAKTKAEKVRLSVFGNDDETSEHSQPIRKTTNEHIYSEVNEPESSSQPYRADDGQLLYVDLEFDPNMTPSKEATVKRQESSTDYADIDYVQTLAENDTEDPEDTYANQKCNKEVNRKYTCKIM